MATDLKLHQVIVLVALLVSLVGTLLVLEKISEAGSPITSATTIGEEEQTPEFQEEAAFIRIVEGNETGGSNE